ncbi:MAG: hypothetical protein H6817_05525 [Phycisphaerales bacterium]|nr:hypothetical protein [Phycisphaerales bacterium]
MTQWFDMTMRRRVTHHLSVMSRLALMLALGVMTTGCPTDGGGDNTGDEPTGSINNLMSNIRISGEQSLTIVYSAGPSDAEVRGFYVEVASTDANASTIGLEVYFANNLSTGDNRTTSLSTGPMPLGIYRVGLDITSGGQSLRVLSTGTIQITTLPDPEFTLPNQNLTVQPGGNVEIAANVGDAENAVQWRLFFVTKDQRPTADADEYGTQISTGSANVAQATWFTAGAGNGEYEIGIFVTDSGQSIASTVASGNTDAIKGPFFNNFTVTLTDEMSADIPPSVSVTQPSSNQNILVADPTDPNEGNVLVNFSVTVFQGPPALQYVDVFYDFDGQAGTGDEQVISASLPVSATNAVFRVASIDVGTTAFLGVTAHDGVTAPVTRYAPGKIRRASFSDTVLNVTSPPKGTVTEVRPGDGVQIRWQLNAPQATGETTVYVRRLDAMDDPLNSELIAADIVTSGLALSTLSYTYEVESSGRFQATVKVDLDGDSTPLIDSSGIVVATTLPEIVWLGKLASGQTSRQGTVFGGVNFEDNAGSAFAGGEDFDRDGIGDFIIVSRYAKPDSLNPTGVGIGEAYLIRGSTGLANHEFNLNTVSSPQLHGMAFTGIPIVSSTSSDETHGIASAFISTDADNDGVEEIWFRIPFANSAVLNGRSPNQTTGHV